MIIIRLKTTRLGSSPWPCLDLVHVRKLDFFFKQIQIMFEIQGKYLIQSLLNLLDDLKESQARLLHKRRTSFVDQRSETWLLNDKKYQFIYFKGFELQMVMKWHSFARRWATIQDYRNINVNRLQFQYSHSRKFWVNNLKHIISLKTSNGTLNCQNMSIHFSLPTGSPIARHSL